MIGPTPRQMRISLLTILMLVLSISTVSAAPRHQQDRRLRYDTPVHSEITNANPEETWTFDGAEGSLVLIDLRADNTGLLDTYLTLIGPNGNTLITDDDGGLGLNSRVGPLALEDAGTYTVLAGRYSGEGGYTLELRSLNLIPAIKPDKPVGGTLDTEHAIDYYLLDTSETDSIFALMLSSDAGFSLPILELFGPEGLTATTEFQEMRNLDPVLPAPGERYVLAVTLNPNQGGGAYQLVLTESDVNLLLDGVTQQGEISYENYFQRHFFQAEQGQRVRITVEAESTLALAIDVTSADSYYYLFSNSGEHARVVMTEIEIPISGLYKVEVRDGSYASVESAYTITLEIVGD